MLLKGDVTIHAPRKKVWDFLTDSNQIGQCMSGVEKIETIEELKRYHRVASVGLGSVQALFNGEVDILELDKPNRVKLRALTSDGRIVGSVSGGYVENAVVEAGREAVLHPIN